MAVVFEGVLVKCRLFEEGHDNSLFKPVRENTFKEGKVYDVGDRGEKDIKAFLEDESRARIQITRLGWGLGYEFPYILFS